MFDVNGVAWLSERQKIDLLRKLVEGDTLEEESEQLCEYLMRDTSSSVRRLAIEGLWGIGNPRHIAPLMQVLRTDRDAQVRASAALVLGTYIFHGTETPPTKKHPPHFHQVRGFLIQTVRDQSNPLVVRRSALEGVSFDQGEDVAELIEWAYTHADRETNLSAVFAMGRNGAERWVGCLAKEIRSDDHDRKIEAIHAAGEGCMRSLTPILRNLVLSKDRDTCIAAIWALARCGGPGAVEQIELVAESEDDEIRRNATEAVAEYHATYPESGDAAEPGEEER